VRFPEFWKKPKGNFNPPGTIPEVTQRIREFLMDSQIPDAHELSLILGCSVISDELLEHEEDQSDIRTEVVAHLVPMLYAFAHLMSEAAVENQKADEIDGVKIPGELWDVTKKTMEHVAMWAMLGAVSQLVDMGFLQTPKKLRRKK
jgi:hypothetical protein